MIRAELLGARAKHIRTVGGRWGSWRVRDWAAAGPAARFLLVDLRANLAHFISGALGPRQWRSAARVLYIRLASRTFNWEPGQRNGRDKRLDNKWGKLMAAEKAQNLQDTFLNHVRKSKTSVTIFLVNGVKLQGFVTWFDNFCVLLRRDGHSQLVYKHAISTIMPAAPIQMFEAVEEAGDHH
jgi:host factor-I protein